MLPRKSYRFKKVTTKVKKIRRQHKFLFEISLYARAND